jgi:hypothetical protein
MATETAREDSCRFDRGCDRQIFDDEERTNRNAPLPAFTLRIVLRIADDLDDGEDRLPAGGVTEREVSLLQARPARRRMALQGAGIDSFRKEAVARAANEEPMLDRHRGFLTGWKYPRRMRRLAGLALVLVLAGCGSSDKSGTPAGSGSLPSPTPTTTTTDGIDPLEGAGTEPVAAPAAGSETALLNRIAVGRHEGYDRVVFQFTSDLPGYRVSYVQPPLKEDGSGNPVTIKGNAVVVVRMEPASGFDLNTGEGVMVYKGPKRIDSSTAGTSVVQELVRTGDFEAVLSWAIGLSDKVDFRVSTATSPSRLIVDFRNH